MGVLDEAALDELAAATGSRAFVADLLQKYVRVTGGKLDELRHAVELGDHATTAAVAHAVKSSSRTLGALQLGELLEELERAASRFEPTSDLLERVAAEFERVRVASHTRQAA
jgi:HPt (histidine-containing phosphotransfer) domain-containing protein